MDRFPKDFMIRFTQKQYGSLRSQIVILKRGQHSRYLPLAFTKHGILMLSTVRNRKKQFFPVIEAFNEVINLCDV